MVCAKRGKEKNKILRPRARGCYLIHAQLRAENQMELSVVAEHRPVAGQQRMVVVVCEGEKKERKISTGRVLGLYASAQGGT